MLKVNLKPTALKTIVSLILAPVLGYLVWIFLLGGLVVCEEGPCPSGTFGGFVGASLVSFALVYAVWSLLQKK
ncbi:MAG: hypothetical protein Q8R53_04125 [Nanoarchaeota archaeon]|nr:hypothetical protein [Nanoarchaeota archaeon]